MNLQTIFHSAPIRISAASGSEQGAVIDRLRETRLPPLAVLIREKFKFEPLVFPAFVASPEDDGRLNETMRQ